MTPDVLCAQLEIVLNRYLALEPAVLDACARLTGHSVAVQIEAPRWLMVFEFTSGGLRVLPQAEAAPDALLAGSAPALLGYALRALRGAEAALPPDLTLEGDAELLHQLRRLLRSVHFSPEEALASLLGDGLAHRLSQGTRRLFGHLQRGLSTLALDTAEYLREETGDLARAPDVEDFTRGVENLREGVDRAEARLRRLERARGAPA